MQEVYFITFQVDFIHFLGMRSLSLDHYLLSFNYKMMLLDRNLLLLRIQLESEQD
ncbi:hypothetical protein [Fischerella sp. JS2]|uniref:hypothetical protein n=1 Tax=Fischerella sp. JS2 TaxID=2597771 RepID=UPI0028EEBB07|nr:hypothetical protein [Fischerella sp. JS2]